MTHRLAAAVIVASLALAVVAKRLDYKRSMPKVGNSSSAQLDKGNTSSDRRRPPAQLSSHDSVLLDNIQTGDDPRGPLIPALVPRPGQTFEVMNKESSDFITTNEYHWNLIGIENGGQVSYPNRWFAKVKGRFFSNVAGYKTTTVRNNQGTPLFKIHLTKHLFNPTRWSWSFRIAHPFTGKILFTINKDWLGAGFLWTRDEWRVYRGRKSDGDQIYYCVSSYTGYDYSFFHSKDDWNNNRPPVAKVSQSVARDFVGLPDVFTLKVEQGEDTALLLATTIIHDMVHEQETADKQAKRHRERAPSFRSYGHGHHSVYQPSPNAVLSDIRRPYQHHHNQRRYNQRRYNQYRHNQHHYGNHYGNHYGSYLEQGSEKAVKRASLPDDISLLEQQADALNEQMGCPTGCSWRCSPGCMVRSPRPCQHWPSEC